MASPAEAHPAPPLPGIVHLPLAPDGWADIVVVIRSTGKPWPEAAIRIDLQFMTARCAVQGRPLPTRASLAARWSLPERDVARILSDEGGVAVGDLIPTDGDLEIVPVTDQERARLAPLASTIPEAIRLCIALVTRTLCDGGGLAAPESKSGQGACPLCGAIVLFRDGRVPAHERAPKPPAARGSGRSRD